MDQRIYDSLEVGDVVEIGIKMIRQSFETKIIGFDTSPGRHPILQVTSEGDWNGLKLTNGDYEIKKILTIQKCAICGGETPYTKDTPIEKRDHYSKESRQLCSECAKKKD